MKKNIASFAIIIFVFINTTAQLPIEFEQRYTRKKLTEVYPSGRLYTSEIILEKITAFKNKIEIDTSEYSFDKMAFWDLTDYIQGIEGRVDSPNDSIFFTYPEDYLFVDLNNDEIEDMIFQSRGPFVDDSPTLSIFISDSSKDDYRVFWFNGVVTEVSNYTLIGPRHRKEFKGLMVNFIEFGCCSLSGWNMYKTEFVFFSSQPEGMDNPENMRTFSVSSADY